jgi:hypothetical protein
MTYKSSLRLCVHHVSARMAYSHCRIAIRASITPSRKRAEYLDARLRLRRTEDKRKHRHSQGQARDERNPTATGSGTHEEYAQAG